jgi:diguanylate cyclase (GGDEF)-like protein
MTSQHINSILIIPLIVSGEVIGTIGCDIINDNRILTSEKINLAEILTNLVAGRIELEKLIANEKKRATELAMLYETSLAITKPYELSKLHNQIIERATWLLDASAGMLYLRTDQTDVFECKVSYNNQYDPIGTTLRLGEGAVGIVAQTSQPLIIEDYVNWDKKPPFFNQINDNFALLSVPVIHQSQTLGVIQIIREHGKPSFESSDADLLSLFSSQVAITLENSRLLTEVQKLAVLDPLTGLLNRRGFAELAEREIDRAHRFKHSLSLLFLDLDHFKKINDEHGHLIGDQILVGIANRCKNILRSVDLTCRYGGEEFVILLVETNLEDALAIAKRINNVIKLYPFITDIGPINITTSIGVAKFENHMHSIDAIIQNADTALYKAKSGGRDCVVPFLEADFPSN